MKLITTSQAAKKIGVTSQTIRNWIDEGYLKAKKVGNTFFVRANTIDSLLDFDSEDDFHAIRESLDREKKAYIEECDEYRNMREDMRFERERSRYLFVAINSGVRTGFFRSVIEMLRLNANLNDREAYFLECALNGDEFTTLAEKFGLTRERLRQIIEKAIRKCNNLEQLTEKVNRLPKLEDENESLKAEIAKLARYIQEISPENAKVVKESELDSIIKLLDTKIIDTDLSVRAINCLRAGRIDYHYDIDTKKTGNIVIVPECKTLGDVCKLRKIDLLKLRNMGMKSLFEIEDFLESKGLHFEMDVDKIYRQKALGL